MIQSFSGWEFSSQPRAEHMAEQANVANIQLLEGEVDEILLTRQYRKQLVHLLFSGCGI